MSLKSSAAVAALLLVATAGAAHAQSTASATGSGSITIIRPLTLTKNADLRFGTVVRPASGAGTAVVSAAGARNVTGGVVGLTSGDTPRRRSSPSTAKAASRSPSACRRPSPSPTEATR